MKTLLIGLLGLGTAVVQAQDVSQGAAEPAAPPVTTVGESTANPTLIIGSRLAVDLVELSRAAREGNAESQFVLGLAMLNGTVASAESRESCGSRSDFRLPGRTGRSRCSTRAEQR